MNDNVIELNQDPKISASVTCTCLECANRFDTKVEPGDITKPIECPLCHSAKTLPYSLVAPPDDIEVYMCGNCGNDLFRDLGDSVLQCAKCGEITEPEYEDE